MQKKQGHQSGVSISAKYFLVGAQLVLSERFMYYKYKQTKHDSIFINKHRDFIINL